MCVISLHRKQIILSWMTHKLPTFTVGMGLNVFTLRPYDELDYFLICQVILIRHIHCLKIKLNIAFSLQVWQNDPNPRNNWAEGSKMYRHTTQLTIRGVKWGLRCTRKNFCNTCSAFGPNNLDSNLDRRGWLVLSGTYFKFSDINPSVILYTCVLYIAGFLWHALITEQF